MAKRIAFQAKIILRFSAQRTRMIADRLPAKLDGENDQQRRANSEANQHTMPIGRGCTSSDRSRPPERLYCRLLREQISDSALTSTSSLRADTCGVTLSKFPNNESGQLLTTSQVTCGRARCLGTAIDLDKQLQRELAVARKIHAGMGGGSREVRCHHDPM
jgi:hypothetical protein